MDTIPQLASERFKSFVGLGIGVKHCYSKINYVLTTDKLCTEPTKYVGSVDNSVAQPSVQYKTSTIGYMPSAVIVTRKL